MGKIEDEIHQQAFRNALQKAMLNLIFTSNWLQHKSHDFFKPFRITPQQFNVLRILKGQYPKGISAAEIKIRMLDQNSDVSRILDRIASKNLITRRTCPTDKRASDVFISETGSKLLAEIEKPLQSFDQLLKLSPKEAEQLSNLLDKSRG